MTKIVFLAAVSLFLASFSLNFHQKKQATPAETEAVWVDSVYNSLTPRERIGQLIVLRGHSDKDAAYEDAVEKNIRDFAVGGVCFFQGTPERQAFLTNKYQKAARLPLFVSMDAEWGLGMRLIGSTVNFPKQLMLGAVRDNQLIYEMGREVARECLRLGVQINFAPDVDINNNAANPVINERSFGENRLNVTAKSFQYMRGLQDGGVMACAKHFPGHGDTDVDSHSDLPIIAHPTGRLDSLELFPFRVLAQHGIGSMMIAHLSVPALDATYNMPTTLSNRVVHGLLRKSIGFDGLIFTDAMGMKGVTKYFEPGQADVRALAAGNDIILLPEDVSKTIPAVEKAIADGILDKKEIEASVRRVLLAKYRYGLTRPQSVVVENIRRDLNTPDAIILKRKLMAAALTLVRDRDGLVPVQLIENQSVKSKINRYASLSLGASEATVFQNHLGFYAPFDHFFSEKNIAPERQTALLDTLKNYPTVFVSIHQTRSKASDDFGLTEAMKTFLFKLNTQSRVVLTVFGNPYSLKYYDEIPTVLLGFTEDENAQSLAAQGLFGAIPLSGQLPVTASAAAKYGQGIETKAVDRLKYGLPETVGMSSDTLAQLDALTDEIVRTGAAPGGQLLVAKNGVVVYQKAWGFQDYGQTRAVKLDDLYDLASVTKVAATTISLMKLADDGKFDVNRPMADFVPQLKKAPGKSGLLAGDILAHQAGLQAWIPFYKNTLLPSGFPDPKFYRTKKEGDFTVEVATDLWMKKAYIDSIYNQIYQSPLRTDRKYLYSDLTMFLGAEAVKNLGGLPVDEFADQNFYQKLGLATMCFNPLRRCAAGRCAPTEEDNYFRRQKIQGYVHDMGAAMLGGVSGHAGLFSNANDLAVLCQMLLNGGTYAGQTYLKKETVARWTTRFNRSSRRGLGFDMKETDLLKSKNMSELASPNTWGHMGFTGNAFWVDPDQQLIFIFLSNRTYPSMENNKLINGDFRPRAQSIVYRAIKK